MHMQTKKIGLCSLLLYIHSVRLAESCPAMSEIVDTYVRRLIPPPKGTGYPCVGLSVFPGSLARLPTPRGLSKSTRPFTGIHESDRPAYRQVLVYARASVSLSVPIYRRFRCVGRGIVDGSPEKSEHTPSFKCLFFFVSMYI